LSEAVPATRAPYIEPCTGPPLRSDTEGASRAAELVEALRRTRSARVVPNEIDEIDEIHDAQCSLGETCTELPTEIATNDGGVDITIDIQSPTWAPFDTVEVYVNPFTTKRTIMDVASGAGDVDVNRYELDTPTATYSPTVNTVPVGGSNRLEASVQHNIVGATEDLWVVVLVRGTDGVSEPLFPIVPNSLTQGSNTTVAQLTDGNLGENGITALAFTNPIRIDVDGGGWSAPGVQVTNP